MIQKFLFAMLIGTLAHAANAQRSLSYFLQAARRNDPTVRIDSIQRLADQLVYEQQKAALTGPLVYADGRYLAAPVLATGQGNTRLLLNPSKNTTDYYGYDLSLTNGGLYRGEIAYEQPLFNSPRTRVLEQQNQLQNAQVAQHTRLTLHQIDKTITDQYLLCQYTLQQEDATRQLIDLLEAQTRVSQTLAQNALLYRADVQLLRIEADRLHTTLASLDAAYDARLLDLYALCGIRDTTRIELTALTLSIGEDNEAISGFVEPFRLDSLALTTGQQLFNLRYKPQLSVYSAAGLNSAYAPDIPQRVGWQAGLRFTQVIFDGRQRQFNDRRTRLLAQGAAWQTDYFNDQNGVRKARIRAQVHALDVQDSAVHRQQRGYDTLLVLYRQQVVSGQLSVINYLTVLRSRASLQQDITTITYNRELLINEYNYWNW